jgi:uncharacterized membrane protein
MAKSFHQQLRLRELTVEVRTGRAQRTADVRVIAAVGREVVIADAIFTSSAVVLQPSTGLAMVRLAGFPHSLPWLRWSITLYVLIGCC